MNRSSIPLIACLCGLSFTSAAQAQDTGFALNRFEPAEAGSDWFAGDSLDLRGSGRLAVGLVLDYAHEPLVLYRADGDRFSALIERQLHAHLGLSLVAWDRLRLSASMPFVLYQEGEPGTVPGRSIEYASDTAPGDLRLGVDLRLLGAYREPFTLALGVQVHLPTGSRSAYSGDEAVRVVPRLQAAGDLGLIAYSARVGLAYRAQDDGFAGEPTGSELLFGATLGARFGDFLIGPELSGSTVITESDAVFARTTTPLELLLGAHLRVSDFMLALGAGPGLSQGLGSPALRALASIEWAPQPEAEPEPVSMPEPPPPDRDGDGVTDARDACVDEAGVASNDPKRNGCPADSDGDGIADAQDACAQLPGVANEDFEKHGCPPDIDGDGIADADDACVETAGVESDDRERHGCPPDADRDGIVDADDACPRAAGDKNADPSKHGCPIARVEQGQIKITERIEFKTNSAKILPESTGVLEAVRAIMVEHPEIEQVALEGHTDSVGRPRHNKRLSQQRTESVLRWLVQHGIERTRLTAEGFGAARPIASNDDEAGREKNRRVEFHIRKMTEQPGQPDMVFEEKR
jgi:outer membrane protein OmpA-like peptidoglycan-associated protein